MENLIKYITTHTTMKEEEAAGYAYDIMCCLKDGDKAQADFLLSSILYLNPPV